MAVRLAATRVDLTVVSTAESMVAWTVAMKADWLAGSRVDMMAVLRADLRVVQTVGLSAGSTVVYLVAR